LNASGGWRKDVGIKGDPAPEIYSHYSATNKDKNGNFHKNTITVITNGTILEF
jgi:hypothetical protein